LYFYQHFEIFHGVARPEPAAPGQSLKDAPLRRS
jgi:hypothetical protein